MSEILELNAELREESGKGAARKLRNRGMVPAVIYGAGKTPVTIAVEERELTKYYRKPQFISQPIEFKVGSKTHRVLPKTVDLHPITEVVRHADFVFIEEEMQKMDVPVVYKNKETCIGIKRGGYFNTIRRTLKVLCPVANLPRKLEIDIVDMHIGRTIKIEEAALPAGAKFLEKPGLVIASIIGKKGNKDDAETTGAAEAPKK